MKKKWAESCRTSVLLQKAARPCIQESHGAEIPPWMEISTVGHWLQPLIVPPRFAFTPSCNIQHFIYCRHNSPLVCETLLTLRVLTWAQKIPCLGFGGHTRWEDAGIKGTFLPLAGKGAIDTLLFPFGLILAVCFFLRTPTSFSLNFQDVLWNGNAAVQKRQKIDSQSSQSAFPGG